MTQLEYVQQLIRFGHLNGIGDHRVDVPLVMSAIELAIGIDTQAKLPDLDE